MINPFAINPLKAQISRNLLTKRESIVDRNHNSREPFDEENEGIERGLGRISERNS